MAHAGRRRAPGHRAVTRDGCAIAGDVRSHYGARLSGIITADEALAGFSNEAPSSSRRSSSGTTLKEISFRARYRAAVLAIHRAGHRIDSKLGDVRLGWSDTLLLLAHARFRDRRRDRRDFLVIPIFFPL